MAFNAVQTHIIRKLHSCHCVAGIRKPSYIPIERLLTPRISKSELKKAIKELRNAGIVGTYKQGKCVFLISKSKQSWEHVL